MFSNKGALRRKILELSIKSPYLHPVFGPPFTPLSPLSVVSAKERHFNKSQYEMEKLTRIIWSPEIIMKLGIILVIFPSLALSTKKNHNYNHGIQERS
jgi:hypothetical protein